MTIIVAKTVGELDDALKLFNPNTPLTMNIDCYDYESEGYVGAGPRREDGRVTIEVRETSDGLIELPNSDADELDYMP